MCMQAFRIILYWTLNYYPFASLDHATLYSHNEFNETSPLSVLFLDL